MLERIVWGPSPDEAIARWSSTYGWHYFQHDPLNSPLVATDGSGAAVERYLYDAFGAATIYDGAWGARGTTAIGNEWQFTGQEWMPGLGLHNYKNRFYQDDLGRFVQQDPLRFDAGDLNLYRYVFNNTANASDPIGLNIYFGGSRVGSGHFWTAVDLPGGRVLRYDYSAKGYAGTGGSSGPLKAFFETLSTKGVVELKNAASITEAAKTDEVYAFSQSAEDDSKVASRMYDQLESPPDYKLLTENCTDRSCEVAGRTELSRGSITPQSTLDRVKEAQKVDAAKNEPPPPPPPTDPKSKSPQEKPPHS